LKFNIFGNGSEGLPNDYETIQNGLTMIRKSESESESESEGKKLTLSILGIPLFPTLGRSYDLPYDLPYVNPTEAETFSLSVLIHFH